MAIQQDTSISTAYRADDLGTVKPQILIGGTTEKFVPNLNISFQCETDKEQYYLNLNRKSVSVSTQKESTSTEKLSLAVGNETDIWHIDKDGRLKWDIEFAQKPDSNAFEWEITCSKGLSFCYQGELTEDELAFDAERPDGVLGSYAVYCDRRHNNYKTGKLCHIYRPLCLDAKGQKTWADLLIKDGKLTITIPQKYLDDAAYPVTLDPTMGYTSTPSSSLAILGFLVANRYACGTSGEANTGTIYVFASATSAKQAKMAVYNNGSSTIAAQSKKSSGDATISGLGTDLYRWHSATITCTGLSSGTDYWLAIETANADAFRIGYDSGTGGRNDMEYASHTYDGTLPTPFPSTNGLTNEMGAYLDYTESAGETATYSGRGIARGIMR